VEPIATEVKDAAGKAAHSFAADDCRAAATVADALVRICGDGASRLDAVNVGSLEVGFQRTFGKFDSALPEFARINDAAYWDYQRSKVYARTTAQPKSGYSNRCVDGCSG